MRSVELVGGCEFANLIEYTHVWRCSSGRAFSVTDLDSQDWPLKSEKRGEEVANRRADQHVNQSVKAKEGLGPVHLGRNCFPCFSFCRCFFALEKKTHLPSVSADFFGRTSRA